MLCTIRQGRGKAAGTGEAELIYNEIMVKQEYFQHGLSVVGTRCVMDIGANIGIFTMAVKLKAPDAIVYAFEPIPETFRVLEQNVHSLGCSDVHLFNLALGMAASRAAGSKDHAEIAFTYFPNMPGNSTAIPALKDEQKLVMDRIFGKEWSDFLSQSETRIVQDWPIFKQVAIETHNAQLREQVREILVRHGFVVFADLGISSPVGDSMVYAHHS
jgi:FkbM family methyltransferase